MFEELKRLKEQAARYYKFYQISRWPIYAGDLKRYAFWIKTDCKKFRGITENWDYKVTLHLN